jgi:hypothetical protein
MLDDNHDRLIARRAAAGLMSNFVVKLLLKGLVL